jgi:tetratricopeptide (TPR) repeat protein
MLSSFLYCTKAYRSILKFGSLSCCLLLLAACSLPIKQDQPVSMLPLEDQNKPAETEATTNAVEIVDRPFPIGTLFSLVAAEMAGSRERYDVALSNYIQQAHITRDAGVAARATHIARYLKAHNAILEMSKLWVELQPEDLEARFILATALTRNGQLNEALTHSIYLLENGSTSIFQALAAQAEKGTDTQRDTLLAQYQELHKQYPLNTQILTGLGLLHQQNGEPKKALKAAQKALKIEPRLIPTAILEAKLLLIEQGGKEGQALNRLQKMLEQYPDDNRLRIQYARLIAGIDLEAAQHQFQLLHSKSPNDPEILFSLALITKELDQLHSAQTLFEKLIPYSHRRSSAYFYLGKIAEQLQHFDIALENYLLVEPGPDFTTALLHSTDILIRNGNIDDAKIHLDSVRSQFPDQAERLYLLETEVLSNHQQYQAAIDLLSIAIQQHPESTQLLYSRAMTYELLEQFDNLEADLTTLLKYDPNNATALNALGYTLANRNERLDEALALIEKALQIKPDDAAIIDSMGWVQYRLGNYEISLLRLRQAMQTMPDHEIAAHLGEVLWVSNLQDEANKVWQQGLELNPRSTIIEETKLRLLKTSVE